MTMTMTMTMTITKNLTAMGHYSMINTRMDRRLTKRRIMGFKLKHKLDKQSLLSVQITKNKPEN